MRSILALAILMSQSLVLASTPSPLYVHYDSARDVIVVKTRNTCQEIEFVNHRFCSRSFPGQTEIQIVKPNPPSLTRCSRSGLQSALLPASELGCRPAIVTIKDQYGTEASVEVPALQNENPTTEF